MCPTDSRLHHAERFADGAALLLERVRAGRLEWEHVELAASLGHFEASTHCPGAKLLDWSDPDVREQAIEQAAKLVDKTLPPRAAADFAERALPAWETWNPSDRRPHQAIAAARAWAACPCEEHRLAAGVASEAAASAGRGAYTTVDTAYTHAAFGADAAACAALGVDSRSRFSDRGIGDAVRASGDGLYAAADPEAERRWQRLRLAAHVLGEIEETGE